MVGRHTDYTAAGKVSWIQISIEWSKHNEWDTGTAATAVRRSIALARPGARVSVNSLMTRLGVDRNYVARLEQPREITTRH